MEYSDLLIYVIELVGTVAFAASGAILGIQKHMDIFGVNVLGITTAVGGGLIRDLILNTAPPNMFRHPSYTFVAIGTATLIFMAVYLNRKMLNVLNVTLDKVLFWMDTIGLGIFTVVGVNTAWSNDYGGHYFLMIFVGVITGVGGGMLRDIMSQDMPYVFVKHIYACASLAGAAVCAVLMNCVNWSVGMTAGTVTVILIRSLAAKYRWNLPRIR